MATMLLAPLLAGAAEVVFPVSAYNPEELAKVREWEKTWVGKKVDKSNIDQVAQFMPQAIVEMYKDPDNWGAPPGEGLYFYIVPYKQVIETKGMIAATKKYSPLVKTDAEGNIINSAEIAGFPFPDPKTGHELAHNVDFQTRGDTYHFRWWAPVVDPRARTDRVADQEFEEMFFAHRVDVDPRPAIPNNPKGYVKGSFLHFHRPPEMLNSRLIVMKFLDESKEYSSHLYYAEFRRIRRISQAERTNAIDGTDMIYDDGNQWDGYINRNTYKYKGRKEMLCDRHQDMTKIKRQAGQITPNNLTFERCNTYVVEVVHQDPKYIYSKRIWYIDPETYFIQWQEMWDRVGQYWKCFFHTTGDVKTAKGEMKNFFIGMQFVDFQRKHGGFSNQSNVIHIGKKISPKLYSLTNLQRTY
jgi:hypothetical protein